MQSPQPVPIEKILTLLINEIRALPKELILVMDDYHLIEAIEIHTSIEFLMENQPENLHLVVMTRYDPPWALHLFRARQEMLELRQRDLSFTLEETGAFLNHTLKFNLPAEDIAALRTRTEGWVVGLQLAAISMEGVSEPATFIQGFTGSNRYVFDYLIEEVLHRQTPEIQDFLLKTSILKNLCAPLCNAVLGRSNSQEMLEYLERANLFLIALDDDRRWYRYHHLFSDLLQAQLARIPIDWRQLHHHASLWFHQNNLAAEALKHAILAQDFDLAIQIVEGNVLQLLETGNLASLRFWLNAIPKQRRIERPWLCIAEAWVTTNQGKVDRLDSWLSYAEEILGKTPPELDSSGIAREAALDDAEHIRGHLALIRSAECFLREDYAKAVSQSQQALEHLPDSDWLGCSQAWMNIAIGLQRIGKLDEALASNQQAIHILESVGRAKSVYHSPEIIQVGILATQGQLRKIEIIAKRLIQTSQPEALRFPITGIAYSVLSRVHRERNELNRAWKCAEEALEISQQWGNIDFLVSAYSDRAEILLAQGDAQGAFKNLAAAKQAFANQTWPPQLATIEAELHLIAGDIEFASRWLEEAAIHPEDEIKFVELGRFLVLSRFLLVQNSYEKARDLLVRLQAFAERTGARYHLIKIHSLQAVAYLGLNQRMEASSALRAALSLGEGENFVRAIIDVGTGIVELLTVLRLDPRCSRGYIDRLLQAFPFFEQQNEKNETNPSTAQLIEALSEREKEVLSLMDSNLTSNEIAECLYIAVSTVRVHIKHIYAKLGVKRRFDAVQRARELGLL